MKHEIAAVLEADHDLLRRMGLDLRACAPADAPARFKQFAAALGGHLNAIEKAVYPGLRSMGWKDVSSDVLVRHARLSHSFAELLTLRHDAGSFATELAGLLDATERLLDHERRDLLPLLARHLDAAQRLVMGLEAQRYLEHRDSARTEEARFPVSEWIEEARLLLGGLQSSSAGGSRTV
ncbi:MAG TPA: hemerythrin domain-containing protein [Albitalea sp.]|nr:hemerythrin domain-containing protein [Albitalea sp.]